MKPVSKQHILNEIRRIALQNGGRAPGKIRFTQETGIQESDWLGRHARAWGDLVSAAGFEANSLQTAYSDQYLLERYLDLIRELKHLPTDPDLRLRRRRDPQFPSHNSFRRIGTKRVLVQKVREYAQDVGSLPEIMALCDAYLGSTQPQDPELNSIGDVVGGVYLLKSGRFYKVGRSNDSGRRQYEIRLQMPEKAKLIHTIQTDDPVGIERYWHQRFAEKRRNGEWFDLDASDVAVFRRRKFM